MGFVNGFPLGIMTPVNPIRILLLDAGNTILYVNIDLIQSALAGRGIPISCDRLREVELQVRFRLDTPELIRATTDRSRWDHYYGTLLDEVGAPREILDVLREYHADRNLWDYVPAEIPATLERLQPRFRLGVVSNSNGSVEAVLRRQGLAKFFETIVDSTRVGVEKPDPKIFRIALARMGAYRGETAYVGDLYNVDIVGARRAGLTAILLDPGNLHGDKDCPRIRTLTELPDLPSSFFR